MSDIDILTDLSPTNLAKAVEENLSAWLPVFGSMGRVYLKNPPGVKRSMTNIPLSLFNSVMDAHLSPDKVDESIEKIKADAILHKVPVLWWIGPSTQPTYLAKYLVKHGFKLDEEGPGMAVDLAGVNVNLRAPAGLSLTLAVDNAAREIWAGVMAEGFEAHPPHDHIVDAWQNLLRHTDPESTFAYTGWLNDKPVATSLLFLSAGVAGIHAVSTIPEARRTGVGAWMTLHALLQGRDRDYRIGVLEASEMGAGVYQSLGFKEVCRISSYAWRPGK
jgi:GNAT superfamily N-acetyltransferase